MFEIRVNYENKDCVLRRSPKAGHWTLWSGKRFIRSLESANAAEMFPRHGQEILKDD